MKKQTKSNRQKQLIFAALTSLVLIFAGGLTTHAQGKYKAGERVECDTTETGKWWTKGTIMPFQKGDFGGGQAPDGSWYRFKADYNGVEYPCKPAWMRTIAGDVNKKENNIEEKAEVKAEVNKEDADVLADEGEFLECPVEQKPGKKAPNSELFKKIIRCKKGEKSVEKGDEGAVKVEVSALTIGTPRPWSYSQDIGNVKPGTVVYPVKATFTVKTLYRKATEVEENAIRILNFYINAFGEWQIGSEEIIKSAKFKRIPKE